MSSSEDLSCNHSSGETSRKCEQSRSPDERIRQDGWARERCCSGSAAKKDERQKWRPSIRLYRISLPSHAQGRPTHSREQIRYSAPNPSRGRLASSRFFGDGVKERDGVPRRSSCPVSRERKTSCWQIGRGHI